MLSIPTGDPDSSLPEDVNYSKRMERNNLKRLSTGEPTSQVLQRYSTVGRLEHNTRTYRHTQGIRLPYIN
jgi:hypothetical protein